MTGGGLYPWMVALLFWASCLGCNKADRVDRCNHDQQALLAVLVQDQHVAGMLHEADLLALDGRPLDAAKRLDEKARPAMQEVIARVRHLELRSRWGESRHKELGTLVRDRRERMESYGDALRAEDLGWVMLELEKQKDLERRAVEVERAIRSLPDLGTASCDPS